MLDPEELLNIIRREALRAVRRIAQPRVGIVTSYNPATHAAKVKYMPEENESGWLPIKSMAVGNDFGVAFAPNIGDQVQVSFQEGDGETGSIIGRTFHDQARPPKVEAGEMVFKHKSGGTIKFNKDGSIDIDNTGRPVNIKGQIKINS